MVMSCLNIHAQDNQTKKIEEAFNAIKSSASGNNWTYKTIDELKSRTESPYITLGGPANDKDFGASIYYKILDLSNNGLSGTVNAGFTYNNQYQSTYLTKAYQVLSLSNNNITAVHNRIGFGTKGMVAKRLYLDNNKLTEFKLDVNSLYKSAIGLGAMEVSLHQNNISNLKGSDFADVKGNSHNGYVHYALLANVAEIMRIDNNRLNFDCIIDIKHATDLITKYKGKGLPGNPDFILDCYPQKPLGGDATSETITEGVEKTLSFSLTHPDNVYSWQLNGKDVPISKTNDYTFTVNEQTAGVWRCKVTNPKLPGVKLYSYDMAVFMQKSGNGTASDIAIQQSTLSVNFPENAIVADFSATDPEGDELFFRLPDRTADNSHFRIINGKTLVSSETLFEKKYIDKYTIEVEVYDRFGGTFRKEFTITKNGTSGTELPKDILLSNNVVEENSADKVVGTLSAKDVDGYSFSLADNEGDNKVFKIEGNDLKTIDGFNYEKRDKYSIRVTALAADGTSIKKDFEIVITDVNDKPHDIILSSTQLKINTPAGTVFSFITAVDEDKTDKLFTYEFDMGQANNSDFFFEDNIIKTKKVFTEVGSKQITIKVKDDENAEFIKTFDIAVVSDQAIENRPPRGIGITNSVISHSLEVGAKIADIFMSDPDGDAGTFSCDNTIVEVEGSTLKLKAKPENNNLFEITIKGSDGKNSIEQTLKIYITKQEGATEIITVGNSKVKVYPNPAQSYIHIDGLDGAVYQILNSNGAVLQQTNSPDIDISELRQGCYILRINTGTEVITRKIIKKN
jgi:hypothetical protein